MSRLRAAFFLPEIPALFYKPLFRTRKEKDCGKKEVLVSDISGREIRDDKGSAKVAISYGDARGPLSSASTSSVRLC